MKLLIQNGRLDWPTCDKCSQRLNSSRKLDDLLLLLADLLLLLADLLLELADLLLDGHLAMEGAGT